MGMVQMIIVVLAAMLTIASGIWVAFGLVAALRCRNGAETTDGSSTTPTDLS